jgi:hypothetical protein
MKWEKCGVIVMSYFAKVICLEALNNRPLAAVYCIRCINLFADRRVHRSNFGLQDHICITFWQFWKLVYFKFVFAHEQSCLKVHVCCGSKLHSLDQACLTCNSQPACFLWHGVVLRLGTFIMRKCLLTLPLAKLRWNAEVVLKICEPLTYEDIHYINNSFCKSVLKIVTS